MTISNVWEGVGRHVFIWPPQNPSIVCSAFRLAFVFLPFLSSMMYFDSDLRMEVWRFRF